MKPGRHLDPLLAAARFVGIWVSVSRESNAMLVNVDGPWEGVHAGIRGSPARRMLERESHTYCGVRALAHLCGYF